MCEYLSFLVDLKGDTFRFEPMLMSHSATHQVHGLKADAWREAEWTADDDGESLVIRVHEDDPHDTAWLRACVLAKWPTRKALEDWLIANDPQARVANRLAKGGDYSTLTGGDRSVLIFWWYDASKAKWPREVCQIGRDGFKPHTPYKCVGEKIIEVEAAEKEVQR